MRNDLKEWKALFEKLKIEVDFSEVVVPIIIPTPASQLIVVPHSVDIDQLCELFKDQLEKHGVHGFIAPIVHGAFQGRPRWTEQLSDMISESVRSVGNQPYAIWGQRHFVVKSGRFVKGKKLEAKYEWCSALTLAEAFWYHILMIDKYGEEYFELNYSASQPCLGTRMKATNRNAGLYWDLQDIKVCLSSR